MDLNRFRKTEGQPPIPRSLRGPKSYRNIQCCFLRLCNEAIWRDERNVKESKEPTTGVEVGSIGEKRCGTPRHKNDILEYPLIDGDTGSILHQSTFFKERISRSRAHATAAPDLPLFTINKPDAGFAHALSPIPCNRDAAALFRFRHGVSSRRLRLGTEPFLQLPHRVPLPVHETQSGHTRGLEMFASSSTIT
jgi:hypothetical protein